MKKFLMILVAAVVTAMAGFAQSKPVVVVVPFDAKNVSQDDVDIISEVFLSEYTSTRKATVVDRGSFDKIKAQQKFQLSDWSNTDKVAQLGKALNAHQIITGQISQFGTQIVCTIKLVDVNTTEVIASTTKRVANIDILFDECSKLAKELASKAALNVKNYGIGDIGPAGGIIFKIDGNIRYEVSDDAGKFDFDSADALYQVNETPYYDWRLPSTEDITNVYNNLVKDGLIDAYGELWTNEKYYSFSFESGKKIKESSGNAKKNVRLVRRFNINNPPVQMPPTSPVGVYTTKISLSEIMEKRGNDEFSNRLRSYLRPIPEGLNCTLWINSDGTCKVEYECLYVEYNWKSNKKPEKCVFKLLSQKIIKRQYTTKWKMFRDEDGSIIPKFYARITESYWDWITGFYDVVSYPAHNGISYSGESTVFSFYSKDMTVSWACFILDSNAGYELNYLMGYGNPGGIRKKLTMDMVQTFGKL